MPILHFDSYLVQVKRKQTQATQLNPSEKIPKLELGQVWFGEEAGGSSQSGRWEQTGKSEEAPPLRRRLTPMSELLHSLLETETSSRGANNETESNQMSMSISEETPPPSITRNLTPMSNLLESLLKVKPLLTVLFLEEKSQIGDQLHQPTCLCKQESW